MVVSLRDVESAAAYTTNGVAVTMVADWPSTGRVANIISPTQTLAKRFTVDVVGIWSCGKTPPAQ
jgi:hypothetical protein